MATAPTLDPTSERLRAMSREGGAIEAAQVKVIGLEEIRAAAGERWARMSERVRSGSLAILRHHTGPDDVVIPAGDGFLVVLAQGAPDEVQQRCKTMQDALLAFYLGEEALKSLRPDIQKHALTADGLSELLANTANHAHGERSVAPSTDAEIMLAPVLITHDQKMGATLAGPIARAESCNRLCYNTDFILDGMHHKEQDHLGLDIAVLDAALTRAIHAQESGRLEAIGACVHASTMQNRRSRREYFGWLADIDPALRRTLFVTVCEIQRGTPLISITEWSAALRSYAARVWLDFHHTDVALASIGGAGVAAAGFCLPGFASAQSGLRAERLRFQMQFWAKTLHSQGLRLVVHGFRDGELLVQAHALGVDLLTSDAHWPFAPDETVRVAA